MWNKIYSQQYYFSIKSAESTNFWKRRKLGGGGWPLLESGRIGNKLPISPSPLARETAELFLNPVVVKDIGDLAVQMHLVAKKIIGAQPGF